MAPKNSRSVVATAPTTRVVYVGAERYQKLSVDAIAASYKCGRQITASQLIQFLIDNYTSSAIESLIAQMKPSDSVASN